MNDKKIRLALHFIWGTIITVSTVITQKAIVSNTKERTENRFLERYFNIEKKED